MRWLEHRIPPPIVALLIGFGMWALARVSARVSIEAGVRAVIVIALAGMGLALGVAGWTAFRRAETTVNAMKPETVSSLVIEGVYRHTRNPMYLGLVLLLVAWAVHLAAPGALLGPVLFVVFITRFQIVPEERALSRKFGSEFETYRHAVRRWV